MTLWQETYSANFRGTTYSLREVFAEYADVFVGAAGDVDDDRVRSGYTGRV
jgi:hypothetical protein